MNGEAIKPTPKTVRICGVVYEFRLDFNALVWLEENYLDKQTVNGVEIVQPGDYMTDLQHGKLRSARAILYAGLMASLPDGTTIEQFGAMLNSNEIFAMAGNLNQMLSKDLPEAKDAPGEPNPSEIPGTGPGSTTSEP